VGERPVGEETQLAGTCMQDYSPKWLKENPETTAGRQLHMLPMLGGITE